MERGREEDCRKSMEEERQVLEVHFVTCSWETRKGRRWHSWLQEKGIPVDEVRGWTRAVLSTVTSVGRLKGKSAKVQGMAFAEGILRKRKRAGGPLGKLTCMWEDGVYLGVKATTAEVIVGNRNGVWLRGTVRRKPAKERWDRSNLEMVVAVPWRKNEDDPKMDGERLKSEVMVMEKEYKEKLEAEEHVPVPKREYISRENL